MELTTTPISSRQEAAFGRSTSALEHKLTRGTDVQRDPEQHAEADERQPSHLLTGRRLLFVFTALILTVLLTALDLTILSTALPTIASDFDAFAQQGWISAAFVLPQTSFLLVFAQLMKIWSAKHILMLAVVLFEAGSVMCAAARNVNVLILGRAISGVGASGCMVAVIQTIAQSTRLEDRPALFSVFGAVYGIASVVGPLVGGALTQHVTWRWCFWLNAPLGGVALVAITFLQPSVPPLGSDPNQTVTVKESWIRTMRIDWPGATLAFGAVTCLVLGLMWGGNTKPWTSPAVIVCLVLAPVLAIVFGYWSKVKRDEAMVPLTLFRSLSVVLLLLLTFCKSAGLIILTYYIPIYYQITRRLSPVKSSVYFLPFMLSVIVAVIITGQIVQRTKRYWHTLVAGSALALIGSVLLYTVDSHTSSGKLWGYQIIAGVGLGMTIQNPTLAMQAEFQNLPHLMGQANGLITFFNSLGGTVGLAIAQPAFNGVLSARLKHLRPEVPFDKIKDSPLSIYTLIDATQLPVVISAFVRALNIVFILLVPLCAIALLCTVKINNIHLKPDVPETTEDNLTAGSSV